MRSVGATLAVIGVLACLGAAGCEEAERTPEGSGARSAPATVDRQAAAAAPVAADPGCDPNYGPCVPQASDVDCAGGSGDGPEYVSGPIPVTGSDVYGLDSDSDGVACEP